MYHPTKSDLDRVESELLSHDQPTRFAASNRLSTWARLDPDAHAEAIRIFRHVLSNPLDGGTVNVALNALEMLGLSEEAQRARLAMLQSPIESVVKTAILGFREPRHGTLLIDLLARRPEIDIRIAVIRTIGRMNAMSKIVLPALIGALDDRKLRPHAIEALGDLGDRDAIVHLEKLLKDRTEAWPIDNHGPMLRVCDLAEESIRRLGRTPR